MTKKHFIELADRIAALPVHDMQYSGKAGGPTVTVPMLKYQEVVDMLADFCRSQNSQFNRSRWMDYIAGECGPSGGKVKEARR